jgi:hypothetical protein
MLAIACPSTATAALPPNFIGVMADGPLTEPGGPLASETRVMARSGVQSMRVVFEWVDVQPFASMSDVPAPDRQFFVDRHGVPTDFRTTDRIVDRTVRAGVDVLPVVQVVPDWAARHPGSFNDPKRYGSPPRKTSDYARFLRTLIERYGPHGDFWSGRPAAQRRPIRRWQVWNEPMVPNYWNDQPFANGYVALLRAAHHAVHVADPGAEVLSAGMPNLGPGYAAWDWLAQLYSAGARGAFDAIAVHPYATNALNVLPTVGQVRALMSAHGDRRVPIVVTEVSWSRRASLGLPATALSTFDSTRAGQARRLRATFRLLAAAHRALGIEGVFWITWLSDERDPADWTQWTGLRVIRGATVRPTPAFAAFRAVAHRLERAP